MVKKKKDNKSRNTTKSSRSSHSQTQKRHRCEDDPINKVEQEAKERNSEIESAHPPLTTKRLWTFRVIAMSIPILLLLGLEMGLNLIDYGYPSSAIIQYQEDGVLHLRDNPKFNWRFFPKRIARTFTPFNIPVKKNANTYRIFILGASAALGIPDSAYGFSRILEVMLAEAWPTVDFQVINVAVTAINSHVVVEIAKDCAQYEPDLFIVYMGNNEVTGPYGPGTVFTDAGRNLTIIRLSKRLKATRLGQLLQDTVSKPGGTRDEPAAWGGMEMFLEKEIRPTDSPMEKVYRHFRSNLKQICEIASSSGAQTMLCTVGANIKDCAPFASLHRADLSQNEFEEWKTYFDKGVSHEQAQQWTQAVQAFRKAETIDSTYAELHFRLGKCHWSLNEFEAAQRHFQQALQWDCLRFRADNESVRCIRDIAEKKKEQDVTLVDAHKLFEQHSPHGCPGSELFHEHVHLNFMGNYLLAQILFENISKTGWLGKIPEVKYGKPVPLDESACRNRLAYTAWDHYRVTGEVLNEYIREPPFTNQAYHSDHIHCLEEELKELSAHLTPEVLQQDAQTYRMALEHKPDDWQLHSKYADFLRKALNEPVHALDHYRRAVEIMPTNSETQADLGLELFYLEHYEESIDHSRKAVAIMPTYAPSYNHIGAAYVKLKDLEKAKTFYRLALTWNPKDWATYLNLIDILVNQNQLAEAVIVCKQALEILPENADLHCRLGTLFSLQGLSQKAQEAFLEALRHQGNFAEAHFRLGMELATAGKDAEALYHLEKSVHFDPKHVEAQLNLGVAMARLGRFDEAIIHFKVVLCLEPTNQYARSLLNEAQAGLARQKAHKQNKTP